MRHARAIRLCVSVALLAALAVFPIRASEQGPKTYVLQGLSPPIDGPAEKLVLTITDSGDRSFAEVLDAIKAGIWDFEPETKDTNAYNATQAMPGTDEKLAVLAARLERGLPLWHPSDRREYDDAERA